MYVLCVCIIYVLMNLIVVFNINIKCTSVGGRGGGVMMVLFMNKKLSPFISYENNDFIMVN